MLGTLAGLVRTKSELVAENALLRKPLIILRRQSYSIPPASGISLPVFPDQWKKKDVMCFLVRLLHS
jgi:hypothetical protein